MHPGSIRRQVGGESLAAPTTGPRPVVARARQYGSPLRRGPTSSGQGGSDTLLNPESGRSRLGERSTPSIVEAAHVLGANSLDEAAEAIGLDWKGAC